MTQRLVLGVIRRMYNRNHEFSFLAGLTKRQMHNLQPQPNILPGSRWPHSIARSRVSPSFYGSGISSSASHLPILQRISTAAERTSQVHLQTPLASAWPTAASPCCSFHG